MELQKLIERLEFPSCEICPEQACCENIPDYGCLFREAADMLKLMQKENRRLSNFLRRKRISVFWLGQKDLQACACDMLRAMANGAADNIRPGLRLAADLVGSMEVTNENSGG